MRVSLGWHTVHAHTHTRTHAHTHTHTDFSRGESSDQIANLLIAGHLWENWASANQSPHIFHLIYGLFSHFPYVSIFNGHCMSWVLLGEQHIDACIKTYSDAYISVTALLCATSSRAIALKYVAGVKTIFWYRTLCCSKIDPIISL